MTIDLGRVTPIYRGAYNAATAYELNDIVLYSDGNLYWHTQETETTGVAPTVAATWTLAFTGSDVKTAIEGYAASASGSATAAEAAQSAAETAKTTAQTAAAGATTAQSAAETAQVAAQSAAQSAASSASAAAASATEAQQASDSVRNYTYTADNDGNVTIMEVSPIE